MGERCGTHSIPRSSGPRAQAPAASREKESDDMDIQTVIDLRKAGIINRKEARYLALPEGKLTKLASLEGASDDAISIADEHIKALTLRVAALEQAQSNADVAIKSIRFRENSRNACR